MKTLANIYVPPAIAKQLTYDEFMVYGALRKYKDNETHEADPSVPTLAKILGKCENTVRKYLKQLKAKGFIFIKERKKEGKVSDNKYNDTNLYTFIAEKFNKVAQKIGKKVVDKSAKNETSNEAGDLSKNDVTEKVAEDDKVELAKKNLIAKHGEKAVANALKIMEKNIKNGYPINKKDKIEEYLTTIINRSSEQLGQVKKALGSIKSAKGSKSNDTSKKPNVGYSGGCDSYYGNGNYKKTAFHNFQSRTSQYTPEELEAMVLKKHK